MSHSISIFVAGAKTRPANQAAIHSLAVRVPVMYEQIAREAQSHRQGPHD